ncbi:MAG: lactaldehyde reductase [Elusimicrobiota bacterium]|jgi:lactaldehyde reductase|nr:lactaldehyde reductase [Elusimicrobiota bacterium]
MARTILNETNYIGKGCRNELIGELKKRDIKKAFVVTDSDLIKFGVANMVTDILGKAGVQYDIFSNLKANPTIKNVQDGVAAFKKAQPQVIIAIGGGSAIDTAKGIGIIINNPDFANVVSLEGVADTKKKAFPIIAFATTSGTAAEVTINYVITDETSHRKLVCVDPNDIPFLAFNDPEMMVSMPKGLTAATGMDALTHAIEGYITLGANPLSDLLCWSSIKFVSENLKNAVDDGKNMAAREGMAYASYVAGMAFSNVGLGIVHSMAHPLGARFDTPHGLANALLLPYVMEYNKSAAKKKYGAIAQAFGVDIKGMSEDQAADAAIDAVKALSKSVDIPGHLSEIGIKESDLEQLAKDAFIDPCTGGNPRKTSVEDILKIYQTAF